VKRLADTVHKAKQDTARFMTQQLRQHVLQHGWDADVAAHLSVVHKDGKLSTEVHPDYADRAFVHEFGNENQRPTAAIRKFANNTQVAEEAFKQLVHHHWKKSA